MMMDGWFIKRVHRSPPPRASKKTHRFSKKESFSSFFCLGVHVLENQSRFLILSCDLCCRIFPESRGHPPPSEPNGGGKDSAEREAPAFTDQA